ncbi:MAG: Ldh family oxidoreductase [Nitrososphaerales archaeon]
MREEVKVWSEDLKNFVRRAFIKAGIKKEHAEEVANHLVLANLRGVDSHGVIRVEYYLQGIKDGYINRDPRISLVKDNPSIALMNGDMGLGQIVAKEATNLAIEKAIKHGIGSVCTFNLSHVGMLGYYGLLIASKKMAGIIFTNGPAMVAPWGGTEKVFGTNPICMVFPYEEKPILLDMASTVIAGMKIMMAAESGKSIPLGWALDKEGKQTTDPKKALEGALLPFGEYKGYGLMLMVELYTAILCNSKLSYEILLTPYTQGGFYVQALNIESLRSFNDYLKDTMRLVKRIRSTKPWEGQERVYLPGELEDIRAEKRSKEGIPIDKNTWNSLLRVAKELDLELPKI